MDEIVGFRVHGRDGSLGGFITWGRLFDPVDPAKTIAAVRKFMTRCGFAADSNVDFCFSLTELSSFPYFYEGLAHFTAELSHADFGSKKWLSAQRAKLKAGREIYFLGRLPAELGWWRASVRFGRADFAATVSYSHPISPLDEGWHSFYVDASLGDQFKVRFESCTLLDAFSSFRDELKNIHEHLQGSAKLAFTESEVEIAGTVNRRGHVDWDIRLSKHSCGLGVSDATLAFHLDDDQSSLPGIIAEIDVLLEQAVERVEERKRSGW